MTRTKMRGLVDNYEPKHNTLRSAVLFGANASGKSGFLSALSALKYLVLNSACFKPNKPIGMYEPFLLDDTCQKAPVTLEIAFIVGGVEYAYKVMYNKLSIELEELYCYKGSAKALLYTRLRNQDIKFGDHYKGARKTIEKMLLPNQLFLSKAAANNVDMLMQPYLFFLEILNTYPGFDAEKEVDRKNFYAKRLAEDNVGLFTKRFNTLIFALDTGIREIRIEENNWNLVKFPTSIPEDVLMRIQENFKYDIKTSHPVYRNGEQIGNYAFEIHQESTGTKNLFALAGLIIDALEFGRVLVVDELGKHLHPNIACFLIQLFQQPKINTKNAQLIFATHDITQLSAGTFRPDQIWFAEKNERGESEMFRCSDLEGVNLNTPLDKWYASGRLGATPIIDDVDFILSMQN